MKRTRYYSRLLSLFCLMSLVVSLSFCWNPESVRADSTSVYSDSSSSVTSLVFPSGSVTDGYKWNGNINYESPKIFPTQVDKVVRTGTLELEKGKSYRLVLSFDAFGFHKYSGYGANKWDWIYTEETLHVLPRVLINGTEFNLSYDESGNSYIFEFTNTTDYVGVEFHLDYFVEWFSGSPSYPNVLSQIDVPDIMFDVYEVNNATYTDICMYEPIYKHQFLEDSSANQITSVSSIDLPAFSSNMAKNVALEYSDLVNLAAGSYKVFIEHEGISSTDLLPNDAFVSYSKVSSHNMFYIGDDSDFMYDGYPSSSYTVNHSGGILPFKYVISDNYTLTNPSSVNTTVPVTAYTYPTRLYIYSLISGSGGTVVDPPIGGDSEEPGTEDTETESESETETDSETEKDPVSSELEEVKKTSKGILGAIKDFFGGFFKNLVDAIAGLFLPEDGFFEDFFGRLNKFFDEKLGFLYVPIEILIDFLTKIMNAQPGEASIPLPEFKWEDTVIISGQDVKLNFDAIPGLQDKIYFVTDVLMIGSILNLLQHKLKEILSK